jgi:sec-independent protein translocase protein TatA
MRAHEEPALDLPGVTSSRPSCATTERNNMGASLLSPTHLMVLAVIALLLFGAKRLPEIARSLGSGLHEFKSTVAGLEHHEPSSRPSASPESSPPTVLARAAPSAAGTEEELVQTG